MVFFFGLATKEIVEATLPGGALGVARRPRGAAARGGRRACSAPARPVRGPRDRRPAARSCARGWAIPCATDIAFSYLVARLIFPARHPAIPFLLLLAVADDALGLLVLAIFYPAARCRRCCVRAVAWCRRCGLAWRAAAARASRSFWPYVLVRRRRCRGPALYLGGLHPALALVPIVPFMPARRRVSRPLRRPGAGIGRRYAQSLRHAGGTCRCRSILFFFGLANAGVPLSSVGPATWLVAGRAGGRQAGGVVADDRCSPCARGLTRPGGLSYARRRWSSASTAGIGFTVALFFATAAFPAGPALDAAKMGALLSFLAAPLAIAVARLVGSTR